MSSSEEEDTKPSGKELRQSSLSSSSSKSKPQFEPQQVTTNTNVDIHASTPTNTGEDPTLEKVNPADGFKKSQRMVNADGTEI
jgi:hypothetical protein